MAKVIILRGLPASGKSTLAAQILAACGNGVRVNRDLLREMLHCGVWSGPNERVTKALAQGLVRQVLQRAQQGHDPGVVIIDDTNLDETTLLRWKELAREFEATVEIHDVQAPVDVCVARDQARLHPVGRHVIVGMALQYHRYPLPETIVLCDIDGTVADCRHRLPALAPPCPGGDMYSGLSDQKNWKAFFANMDDDPVIETVRDQVLRQVAQGAELFFVSGRPEPYRALTEAWLDRHGFCYQALFMRRAFDRRSDVEVKQGILEKHFPEPYRSRIVAVYDDRPVVIRDVWQRAGLRVVDCGHGEEF